MAPIVLCDCTHMTEEQWLACRQHGPNGDIPYTVGGSDISTIFGINPWKTSLELWMEKKGLWTPPPKSNSLTLWMGHQLEPVVADLWSKMTGNQIINDQRMFQNSEHPYFLANVDRIFVDRITGDYGVLECKTCTFHKADEWANGGYPDHYELQLRGYLGTLCMQHGSFAALWGNNPDEAFAMPTLERDIDLENQIFERLDRWNWSLIHDKRPSMRNDKSAELALKALVRIYSTLSGEQPTISLPSDAEADIRLLYRLQTEIADMEKQKKAKEAEKKRAQVAIAELMKEHERAVYDTTTDHFLIDFKTKKSERINAKKVQAFLADKHPELSYGSFCSEVTSRTVSVSIGNGTEKTA